MINKNSKKTEKKLLVFESFKLISLIQILASGLFLLFTLSFHGDISLLAFPISIVYTFFLAYVDYLIYIKKDGSKIFVQRKLIEYLPYVFFICSIIRRAGKYGTSFVYDLISVLIWCVIVVCSIILDVKLNPKKIDLFKDALNVPLEIVEKAYIASGKKSKQTNLKESKNKKFIIIIKRIRNEIIEWVDAIVWAIFTVLFVQIFLIQLYKIPSESMVGTFLINDIAAVSKIDCGPKYPLTDVGLSDLREYKRGDTIVLRNPHYSLDRKSEVKTVVSQIIYMLTFMQVNLNKTEDGELKYDPLVKRIVGLPGEQLVMQDGTLYYRTKDNLEFRPVESDKKYAVWNLAALPEKIRSKVDYFPLSSVEFNQGHKNYNAVVQSANENYEKMLEFEQTRRNLDLFIASKQAEEIVRKMQNLVYKNLSTEKFSQDELHEFKLFYNAQEICARILTQEQGFEWFSNFMTSWIPNIKIQKDMYSEANYKLNVMAKLCFGNMVLRYAQLMTSSVNNTWNKDKELIELRNEAILIDWYIQQRLDERNMPVFPKMTEDDTASFIPQNCYFMMGDNRFNSLDLRHSDSYELKALSNYDSVSVEYYTNMAPQYINKKYIIGKPVLRIWPRWRISRLR